MPKPTNVCEQCGQEYARSLFSRSPLCDDCRQSQGRQRILTMRDVERAGQSDFSVTSLIAGGCAAVFVGMALSGVSLWEPTTAQLIPWGANYAIGTLGGQWWRLLTYMFVHAGVIHIGLNMWVFWSLGRVCEEVFGRIPFLLVYLLTGVGAGLASLLWHPGVVSVGASGAIFGIAGALFSSLYLKNREVPTGFLRAHVSSIGTFILYNLIFGFILPFVDNAAHVGGLITGVVIGALLPRSALTVRTHRGARTYASLLLVAMALGAITFQSVRRYELPIRIARGEELVKQEHYAEAVPILQKAVAAHPEVAEAQYALGFAYLKLKKFDLAVAPLERAVALAPNEPMLHVQLAWAYEQTNRQSQAEQQLRDAARMAPSNADVQFYLAAYFVDHERWREAVPQLETVLKLDPNNQQAKFALAKAQAALAGKPIPQQPEQ